MRLRLSLVHAMWLGAQASEAARTGIKLLLDHPDAKIQETLRHDTMRKSVTGSVKSNLPKSSVTCKFGSNTDVVTRTYLLNSCGHTCFVAMPFGSAEPGGIREGTWEQDGCRDLNSAGRRSAEWWSGRHGLGEARPVLKGRKP